MTKQHTDVLKCYFETLKKMLQKQNSVGPKLNSLFENFQFLSMLLKLNFLSHPLVTSMSGKGSTIHLNQTHQLPSMQNVFMDAGIAGKT